MLVSLISVDLSCDFIKSTDFRNIKLIAIDNIFFKESIVYQQILLLISFLEVKTLHS